MMRKRLERHGEKQMRRVLADILGDWVVARLTGNRPLAAERELLAHLVWHHIDGTGPCAKCRGSRVAKRWFRKRGRRERS
jgi:hypothetical protein